MTLILYSDNDCVIMYSPKIPFEDQDDIKKVIYNQYEPDKCKLSWCDKGVCHNQCSKYKTIEKGTFYTIEYDGEVEVIETELPTLKVLGQGFRIEKGGNKIKYARLIPRKEESQDELWAELLGEILDAVEVGSPIHGETIKNNLKQRFFLTRK